MEAPVSLVALLLFSISRSDRALFPASPDFVTGPVACLVRPAWQRMAAIIPFCCR